MLIFFIFQNGTWYHLDVHSKPYFLQKPDDIVYVSVGDSIILTCQVYLSPNYTCMPFTYVFYKNVSQPTGLDPVTGHGRF